MLFDEIINENYEPREYPALAYLSDLWMQTRPFEGLHVLVGTPVFRNTLLQYRALMAGGAMITVGYSSSMPYDEAVVAFLKKNGISVVCADDVKKGDSLDSFDLILDCAGQFSFCSPRKGFVELTRSGVPLYEKSPYPVYVADSGIVKRIETTLGTGDGYFRALELMNYSDFEGKNLVVFGSGKVGCGIALQGVRRGMNVVTITDVSKRNSEGDFSNVLENNHVEIVDHLDEKAVLQAVERCDYLVTATGVKGALTLPVVQQLMVNKKIVAANMGVEDEFGTLVPRTRVLNKKAPLNFVLEEPTHLKYIDASLALHAALGQRLLEDLAQGGFFKGPRGPASDIEQKLLVTTIQNGKIGEEICDMLR